MDRSNIDRLFAKVIIGRPDECWGWRGGKDRWITLDGKNRRAPGVLLEWKLGRPLRKGCRLAYTCGNTGCCNPAHIVEYSPEEALSQRLWALIARGGPDECWEWQGDPREFTRGTPGERPRFSFRDRSYVAYRLLWQVERGEIPEGLWVLHSCDNGRCCNPAHLFLGTPSDNVQDMLRKGRGRVGDDHYLRRDPSKIRRGEASGRAVLTWAKVREIRRLYREEGIGSTTLARRFGVSESAVSSVIKNKTWLE